MLSGLGSVGSGLCKPPGVLLRSAADSGIRGSGFGVRGFGVSICRPQQGTGFCLALTAQPRQEHLSTALRYW